jgi:hypothetical protein
MHEKKYNLGHIKLFKTFFSGVIFFLSAFSPFSFFFFFSVFLNYPIIVVLEYIVVFIKVLTIYLSEIHPFHQFSLSPLPLSPFSFDGFICVCVHVCA